MKNKRFLSAVLAAVTLLTVMLASCTGGTDPADTSAADVTTTVASDETTAPVTTEYDPLDAVAVEDFGGYVFNMLIPTHDWAIVNMTSADITADTIQDALYSRQVNTETRLNVELNELITTESVAAKLQKMSAATGEDVYDIALVPTYEALNLYKNGFVYDIASLNNINLDNPWWEQKFNADVNIGDRRYLTFGNANLIYYSSFYIFVFNTQMIKDNNLENPYDLVASKEWTWDKVYEMMQTASVDTNNDGVYMPADGDTLGLTGHINHSRNIRFSSGEAITKKGADGYPVYEGLSDAYISTFQKFTDYFITSPYVAIAGATPSRYTGYTTSSGLKNYIQVFSEGKSLFLTTGTNEVISLRNSETEYGIVVVPKATAAQKDYITPVYSAAEGIVIPTNVSDVERTALILETIGAYSYNNIVEKHIKIVLHSKVAKDETAVDMINLAYASGAIDTAMANNFGQCTNMLNNLDTNGSKDVASIFGMIGTKISSDIKAAIEGLE